MEGLNGPYNLFIKVVEARNVAAVNSDHSTSDPYCVITLASFKEKTNVVKKTLRPRWNQNFKIEGVSGKEEIAFTLMDWNRFEAHVWMGEVKVKTNTLTESHTKEGWYPIEGKDKKGSGELHLIFHLAPKSSKAPVLVPTVEDGHGRLFVHVVEGKDLAVKDRLSGTSDPYCIVILGNDKYQTDRVEKDLNPHWDDEEYFFEVEKETENLEVQVWDWNKIGASDPMGHVLVPVKSLANDGKTVNQWFKLQPMKKEAVSGEILLVLQYTSAKQAAHSYRVASDHYLDLEKILMSRNLVIICTLLKLYENNDLIRSVVRTFSNEEKAISLLNQVVYRELKTTKSENTLFRTDSFTTKTVVSFLKFEALESLRTVLGGLIDEILKNPDGFEVDPVKCKDEGIRKQNLIKLRNASQKFADTIFGSVNQWPPVVRSAFVNIRKLVSSVFPASSLKAVGAFLFLRFLCPALIAPEGFELVKGVPSKEGRRSLCLVAKVLQNLANIHEFKEEYMTDLNSFVQQNVDKLNQFYDTFSSEEVPLTNQTKTGYEKESEKFEDMALLVTHLNANLASIESNFSKDPRIANDPAAVAENAALVKDLKKVLEC